MTLPNANPGPEPEPEMRTVGLRMAKATKADLEDACILNGILSDVFEDETLPRDVQGNFPEDEDAGWFDHHDGDHLLRFYNTLQTVYLRQPGGMNRVIWGMDTLLRPDNKLVDPALDYLAAHPDSAATAAKLEALQEDIRGLLLAVQSAENTLGKITGMAIAGFLKLHPETHHET